MDQNSVLSLDLFRNALTSYVVTPVNAFGLGGFVFDTEGETVVQLTSEITDHFLEDGTTVSDHIANKPKKVTLKNYVGELVHRQDDSTNTFIQNAVRKLTVVNSYLPDLTSMAQQVLDLRMSNNITEDLGNLNLSRTINRVSDLWAMAKNLTPPTARQQQAYMFFKAMRDQKLLVSVQTPFEFMNNMAIESITSTQQEGEKYVSDFTITLKEIRKAKDIKAPRTVGVQIGQSAPDFGDNNYIPPYQPENLQNRAVIQRAPVTNQGSMMGAKFSIDELKGYMADMGYDLRPIDIN